MTRFICFLSILALSACGQKKNGAELTVQATRTAAPLQIDGLLDEEAYSRAEKIMLKNSLSMEPVTDNAYTTTVQVLYDDRYLYLAYSCRDRDIHSRFTTRDDSLWLEEAVEVFIDTDDSTPNEYVEIEVSPRNILYDSYIVDPKHIEPSTKVFQLNDIHTAVAVDGTLDNRQDEDRMWTVEMAIPFAELKEGFNASMLGEAAWKINFYRINEDEGKGPRYCAWSPTQGSFHKPELFGVIRFK